MKRFVLVCGCCGTSTSPRNAIALEGRLGGVGQEEEEKFALNMSDVPAKAAEVLGIRDRKTFEDSYERVAKTGVTLLEVP